MKLDQLLLELPMMEKLSVVESPDQQQIEKDFGKLAFAFLRDRAPQLMPFLIGFETVEAAPDGSRSVGLFGFRIGEGVYYIPVFFINNQIKGMDSLYSRNEDLFMPLTEDKLNSMVSKQAAEMGEAADPRVRDSFNVPDFSLLVYPPQLGVGGRDSGSIKASEMMADLKTHFVKMAGRTAEMMSSDPEIREMLAGLVASASGVAPGRADVSKSALHRYLGEAGPGAVVKLAGAMRDPDFARSLCSLYDHTRLLSPEYADRGVKSAEKKVEIVTADTCSPSEDESVRREIVSTGFSVKDRRRPDEQTEMMDYRLSNALSNPTEPGQYDVLMHGGVKRCDVLMPSVPSVPRRMQLLVDRDGNWTSAHSRRVFVNGARITPEEKETLFRRASDASDMKAGSRYVLVNENMKSTLPFRVRSIARSGEEVRYIIDFCDCVEHDMDSDSDSSSFAPNAVYAPRPSMYDVSMYLSPTAGSVRLFADQMVVPQETWRALELKDQEPNDDVAMTPASYSEVEDGFAKIGMHSLQVESRDGGVAYAIELDEARSAGDMTYKSACLDLVLRYGLSSDNARNLLKEAAAKGKVHRTIKFAQIPMQVVPPQIPPYMDQGYDSVLGVPTQNPQINYVMGDTVVPPRRPTGPGSNINVGGEATMQQRGAAGFGNTSRGNAGDVLGADAAQLANMAAQSGQRQVFDHTVVGGMARTYDTDGAIDTSLPAFIKALDRLGRLLFLFYWKNDDFAQRFGTQDLPSMEDNLRSVYRSFGDLTLKLGQRSIDASGEFKI